MKRFCLACCVLLLMQTLAVSQALTIQDCYRLARDHYPMTKQHELIQQSNQFTVDNIGKGFLPQFGINGQASYQSAVTELPIKIPNVDMPPLSKDQYKLYGEVTQAVYDGGVTRQQKKVQEAKSAVDDQSLEVELYKLKDRINQLFFGILLVEEQLKQTAITNSDIEAQLKKTEAAIANGAALRSNGDVLKAEIIKNNQHAIELKAMRNAYRNMLGLFIGSTIDDNTKLVKPEPILAAPEINRPELSLYEKQLDFYHAQEKLIAAKNLPRLSLFAQGGLGRPALNFLSNKFEGYYIGGVRLSWSLTGFYTAKNDRSLLDISRKTVNLQKETFLFNTKVNDLQQQAELKKWSDLLQTDDEVIALRTSVKHAAAAQLENGVITGSDFIREVNAEDQAKQNKTLHQTQLLLAQYNIQWNTGN